MAVEERAGLRISVYAAKYDYNFWRPLTAIRNADVDGNPDTDADPDWTSLLTASNHPEYPSAHRYQAGAAAQVLAATFGDDVPFSTGSLTLPNVTRAFDGFSQAAAEVGESRIYGGIHFRLAVEVGLTHGAFIGRLVERQGLHPSGLYQLVASHRQKCLDVPEWSVNDGMPVVQWACNGGENQTWNVETASDGCRELPFEVAVLRFAFGEAEPPAVVVDHEADMNSISVPQLLRRATTCSAAAIRKQTTAIVSAKTTAESAWL